MKLKSLLRQNSQNPLPPGSTFPDSPSNGSSSHNRKHRRKNLSPKLPTVRSKRPTGEGSPASTQTGPPTGGAGRPPRNITTNGAAAQVKGKLSLKSAKLSRKKFLVDPDAKAGNPTRRAGKKITHEEMMKQDLTIRTRYEKQRCAFHDELGDQCRNMAVGKSTCCKHHGGNPIVPENLLTDRDIMNSLLVTKYEPGYHALEYIMLSKIGKSPVEIAAEFNVGVGTLQNWSEKFESFNAAYDIGAALYESWWMSEGKENLSNIRYNTSLFKFLTGNSLGYSDKIDTKSTSTNLHGVLLIPGRPDQKTWEAGVKQMQSANASGGEGS